MVERDFCAFEIVTDFFPRAAESETSVRGFRRRGEVRPFEEFDLLVFGKAEFVFVFVHRVVIACCVIPVAVFPASFLTKPKGVSPPISRFRRKRKLRRHHFVRRRTFFVALFTTVTLFILLLLLRRFLLFPLSIVVVVIFLPNIVIYFFSIVARIAIFPIVV